MGFGMAKNVREKMPMGSTLYITDVNRAACDTFAATFDTHGPVKIVESAREVAEHAMNIISIVPAAQHVQKVYLDTTTGVIAASRNADRLMLECSTIDAQSSKDVGQKLKEAGVGEFIDTPVSVSPSNFSTIVPRSITKGCRSIMHTLLGTTVISPGLITDD